MTRWQRSRTCCLAQWTGPEHKTLTGDDVYPEQKVVPSSPDPENDPEFQAMKRAREQKKP